MALLYLVHCTVPFAIFIERAFPTDYVWVMWLLFLTQLCEIALVLSLSARKAILSAQRTTTRVAILFAIAWFGHWIAVGTILTLKSAGTNPVSRSVR